MIENTTPTIEGAKKAPSSLINMFACSLYEQEFAETEIVLGTVSVRKPYKGEFIRVHADYKTRVMLVEDPTSQSTNYLVHPRLREHPALSRKIRLCELKLVKSSMNAIFLWPIRINSPWGKDDYSETALVAAEKAKATWLSVEADAKSKRYELVVAKSIDREPVWPTESFEEIFELAFRDYTIESGNHPLIQKFEGRE